jgi:hypothetical protein
MSKFVRSLIDIVNEAPISGIEAYGYDPETQEKTDFQKGTSFSTIDQRLLTSPKGIQKIVRAFGRTPFTFEVFFVNMIGGPDGNQQPDNDKVDDFARLYDSGVHTEYFGIPGKPGVIRVVMISNLSPPEAKIAMTGWILAHKIGHSLQDHKSLSRPKKFEMQIDRVKRAIFRAAHGSEVGKHHERYTNYDYGQKFAKNLTMKSARAGHLNNEFEMFAEIVAQYLISGKVTMKDVDPAAVAAVNAELEELFTLLEGLVLVEV